jgi:hypothetical protein
MPGPLTLGTSASTLAVLQAMQSIVIGEVLVGVTSPFAALSASDATRYGVSRAVFIGRPKDFKDAYLPQCVLWLPERDEAQQPVELVGYAGRVSDVLEVTVQAFADLRSDWYAAEQQILAIRDALWPVLLKHRLLGGGVQGVTDAEAREGRGLCYEEIAGTQYRCYELIWTVRQQYNISGGLVS